MIGSTARQSSLFYVPLARQAVLLKDDLIDPVDALLDDPELVSLVRQRLASRRPLSPRTGRPGIAPDRLLRCCVLKHLKGWSFRELERELRSNLVYRRFTRFDADPTPNYATFSRCCALLGADVTQRIHDRVVARAREEQVAHGRRLRTDTTVVETNVHYPTDSALLGDGVRVLTRSLQRVGEQCAAGAVPVVNHGRAVKRRLLEINRAAKSLAEASQQRLKDSYGALLKLTRGVLRQATAVVADVKAGQLPVVGSAISV
jgi:IS5 family transposase